MRDDNSDRLCEHSRPCYDADGNYLSGREPTEDEAGRYYGTRDAFDAAHPLPVALVNYCSGDHPMYVVAVPSTVRTARRGNPTVIDLASLVVTDEERARLVKFFADFDIEVPAAPAWLLTSY